MIKGLQGSSSIVVDGGNTSLQYVSQDTNNPMQGMVRVYGTDLQVFNGGTWVNIQTSYATIRLTPETEMLLQWIRDKRAEEQEIESLAADHPAVRIAKENLNAVKAEMNRAEQQLKATLILSKEFENNSVGS